MDVLVKQETYSAENWLARLEDQASSIVGTLRCDPTAITYLTEEQEDTLSRYIAAQFFRTQVRRGEVEAIAAEVSSDLNRMARPIMERKLGEHFDPEVLDKWHADLLQGKFIEEEKAQFKQVSVEMLREVQGFGNLFRACPWRIGRALGAMRLYTSDNPISRYLAPIRTRWDFSGLWAYDYFFPLSEDVLLKIERRPDSNDSTDSTREWGKRRRKDFSDGEVSVARHIITSNAHRFLYGESPFVPRDCAITCMRGIELAKWKFAYTYLGFNPNAPPQSSSTVRRTNDG